MTTIELDVVRVFIAVAQAGGFSKAARVLGLDKSKVSRDVARLEASLGTTLLQRTTRSVRLSAEGEALVGRVAPLLASIEDAVAAITDRVAIPSGDVTLTTTPDLGRELLAGALARFRLRFPAVRLKVLLTNDVVDLLADNVDLALRVGRTGNGQLVARKLGDLAAGFFAAPAYLQRRGVPAVLEDLARHDGLWPAPPRVRSAPTRVKAPPQADVECSDFGLLAEVARAGGGVALLPTFLAHSDLGRGSLVRVLPEVSLLSASLYLVSRTVRTLTPRVAALRSFLLEARLLG